MGATRVGVVGAGVTGLCLVHELTERGVDVVALEAEAAPGGLVRTHRVDGRVLECGPQRLRRTPLIEGLLEDLGLTDRLVAGTEGPLYVYHDGALRVAPLSVREAVTTDLLSWRGKARVLLEPLTGPPRAGETVEGFLARVVGEEAATRWLGPLYGGLYGSHPDEMPVEYSLARAMETAGVGRSALLWALRRALGRGERPPICSLEGGLEALPRALYAAHDDRIHLDTPVRSIAPDGEGFRLEADADAWTVDRVAVTTPAPAAASLLAGVDPDFADRLDRLRYTPIAVVHLDAGFEGEGVGAIVPPDGDLPVSGCTWNASVLGRDRLFTCYLDPTSYPALGEADDDTLGTVAATAFEEMTGASADPLHVHRWDPGMPAYDRSWTALDGLAVPPGVDLPASYRDRPGIPGRLRHARRVAARIAD